MKEYKLFKIGILKIIFIIFILFLLYVSPLFLGVYGTYLLNLFFIYIIITTGLNILTGNAGQISFGQAGFVAIGAYTSALLITHFHIPFIISIIISAFLSSIIAFILGFPILRLREIYLAMITLAWTMIIQLLVIHMDKFTNGWNGFALPSIKMGPLDFNTDKSIYYVIITFTLILFFIAKNIDSSNIGRIFISIRDSEVATNSLGTNTSYYKSLAFAISAFYAGVGGGLYAVCLRFIAPDDFAIIQSLDYVLIIAIGGIGNLFGPIYGSLIIIILGEWFRAFKTYQELLYGIMLLLCIIFLPKGISGILKERIYILLKRNFING